MNKTCAIIAFFISINCFFSQLTYAVQLNAFKSFPNDNPLSYQSIPSIAQDQDGFIWFGSLTGLHRYDGHQIVNYHHDEANPDSISSGGVSALLFDNQGQLWVGTRGGGLNLFDADTQTFKSINTTTVPLTLTDDNVYSLLEDSNNNLWIGTGGGINLIKQDAGKQTIKHLQFARPVQSKSAIVDMIETQDKTVWAATDEGIAVFDLDGHFIRYILPGKNGDNASRNNIRSILQRNNGIIWIGTFGGGLIKYDPQDFSFDVYSTPHEPQSGALVSNTVNELFEDSQGNLWIGTDKGLLIYDENNNSFAHYVHNVNDRSTLANDVVNEFFEDSQGMMWIGTFGGVNIWDPNVTSFERYTPLNQTNLKHPHISSFSHAGGQQVYIGGYGGGIYRLDKATNIITAVDLDGYFEDKTVTALLAEQNILWVGTRDAGLYRVEFPDKTITPFQHDPQDSNTLSGNAITSIIRDHRGRIWVGTFGSGMSRVNHDDSITRFMQSDDNPSSGPSDNNVIHLLLDNEGYIWVTNYGAGINRLDLESEIFTHIKHDEHNPKSLSSDITLVTYKDHKGSLWVGTQDSGMDILSLENQRKQNWQFDHLDIIDGMKSSTIFGLTEDGNQNIWFISTQGISRYSPLTLKFSHFGPAHGLVDNQFNLGAVYRDLNKRLYFGSPKGFNAIVPEEIALNSVPPQTHLTNVLRLNEPMAFKRRISDINDLTFEYSDRLISIEYVGLNYADPDATNYRYRLHGFDQEWIDAGKLKRATYTNLPSGSYQFEVIATTDDQNWTPQGRRLNITIEPAPWQTWWAYLMYATAVALALLGYSRFVNRKLQIEQQQKITLKQQVEEQTKEFQLKNVELEHANKQLENAATTDKLTGVRSRRYLDIYIEQATRLMSQIHLNILPVQRNILPRLYFLMVRIGNVNNVTSSQLVNLTDLLLYSRNDDDLVIRWSEDTFAVIGYEKDDNARELASRLVGRCKQIFADDDISVDMAYCFYPFNFEQPMALSWDQVSVLTEFALNRVKQEPDMDWLGLYAPKEQPFDYLEALKLKNIDDLAQYIKIRRSH